MVHCVNDRCGLDQRKTARRFQVPQSTISRHLHRRTPVFIKKRSGAPTVNSHDQEMRVKTNCGKLCRKLLDGCELISSDEKHFPLSGDPLGGNSFFYSMDPRKVQFLNFESTSPILGILILFSAILSINCHEHLPVFHKTILILFRIPKLASLLYHKIHL